MLIEYTSSVKIKLFGMPNVGKKTLGKAIIDMYKDKSDDSLDEFEWQESCSQCTGVFMIKKTVSLASGKRVTLQITYNTIEQEFHTLTSSLFANADAIIFVYDVTSRESFERVNQWLRNLGEVFLFS
jgi:GTPase SAR1 family protein